MTENTMPAKKPATKRKSVRKPAQKPTRKSTRKPASRSNKPLSGGITPQQIRAWMPPIHRGLIPISEAAEKMGLGVQQLSAYYGAWKRKQTDSGAMS